MEVVHLISVDVRWLLPCRFHSSHIHPLRSTVRTFSSASYLTRPPHLPCCLQGLLRRVTTLSAGLLIGTALIVIIPEGVESLFSDSEH